MKRILRYIAVVVVLIGGYFAMSYMQQRFDHADLKKAVAAVQEVHPQGDKSIRLVDALSVRYGIDPERIEWKASIQSKWWGTVRVTARIPDKHDTLTWLVNVSSQEVMPESQEATQLLR